jgi:hypothetical protein
MRARIADEEGAEPKCPDKERISSLKKVENDMDDHETRRGEGGHPRMW